MQFYIQVINRFLSICHLLETKYSRLTLINNFEIESVALYIYICVCVCTRVKLNIIIAGLYLYGYVVS